MVREGGAAQGGRRAGPHHEQARSRLDPEAAAETPPEEAVGPGAKWEVKLPIKSQGITITQTTLYELAKVEGERLATKATISQTAANQKVENPSMPAVKLDLTKMSGTGGGDIIFELDKIAPLAASMDMKSELEMGMNMGGQKQTMNMNIDVNLHIEGK